MKTQVAASVRAIAGNDSVSYWLIGSDVHRVNSRASDVHFDSWGVPMGSRWECSHDHWLRFRACFDFVADIPAVDGFGRPLPTPAEQAANARAWDALEDGGRRNGLFSRASR